MFNTYIFDLYGTLVDIRTDEESLELWGKMSLLYEYKGASYTPSELRDAFEQSIENAFDEATKKDRSVTNTQMLDSISKTTKLEIQIEYVYQELFRNKGVEVTIDVCDQLAEVFRALRDM